MSRAPIQSVHDLRFRPIPPDVPFADAKIAIRQRMVELKLSQQDVATQLGISQKHVSDVILGKSTGSWPMLVKIADAVGLELVVIVRPKP